jgi:hypothetical protein
MHFDEVVTDLAEEENKVPENMFAPIFDIIPEQYRDQVYRSMCQAVHPDHGGNVEQMKKLNEAYSNANKKTN